MTAFNADRDETMLLSAPTPTKNATAMSSQYNVRQSRVERRTSCRSTSVMDRLAHLIDLLNGKNGSKDPAAFRKAFDATFDETVVVTAAIEGGHLRDFTGSFLYEQLCRIYLSQFETLGICMDSVESGVIEYAVEDLTAESTPDSALWILHAKAYVEGDKIVLIEPQQPIPHRRPSLNNRSAPPSPQVSRSCRTKRPSWMPALRKLSF